MSWVLFCQIALLMLLAMFCIVMAHGVIADKRLEVDHKRKAAGS